MAEVDPFSLAMDKLNRQCVKLQEELCAQAFGYEEVTNDEWEAWLSPMKAMRPNVLFMVESEGNDVCLLLFLLLWS